MAAAFADAEPFPHMVIDDFLDVGACAAILEEFDRPDETDIWGHYVHYNERKLGATQLDKMGPRTQAVVRELSSPKFLAWLERMTGISGLIPDPELDGGGLHKIERGGYLNIHVDFLAHTTHRNWSRQLNLLIYLNRDWDESYGGALELWDKNMTRRVREAAPLFNRCIIFPTTPGSYHGHPTPLSCPEGESRKSLALYYFRDEGKPQRLTPTNYRARPEEPFWKHGLVAADRWALRAYSFMKRYVGLRDGIIQRLLKRF
ncbi:MAG: 2OG-Fe(II) oxygenase [Rhodospirillaceae bacterium]|nr:2OG-Fe(II) oxygenase [Rhodospirillaceae bacterium]